MSLVPGIPGVTPRRPPGEFPLHRHTGAQDGGTISLLDIVAPPDKTTANLAYLDIVQQWIAEQTFTEPIYGSELVMNQGTAGTGSIALFGDPNSSSRVVLVITDVFNGFDSSLSLIPINGLSASRLLYVPDDSGVIAVTGGSSVQNFVDSLTRIVGSSDPSKKLAIEVDGFTTATTRTLTPQDASYIIAGLNLVQTFTKPQTIQPDGAVTPFTIQSYALALERLMNVLDGTGANVFYIDATGALHCGDVGATTPFHVHQGDTSAAITASHNVGSLTAARSYTYPDASGTFDLNSNQSTLSNKTLSTTGNSLRASTVGTGTHFADNSTTTKRLYVVLSSASGSNGLDVRGTSRTYKLGDFATPVAVLACGTPVDLSGQTAGIGATNLYTSPPTGQLYAVDVYAECTTASGSGTPTLDVTIGWTDRIGATTQNAVTGLALSATGRASGTVLVRPNSGNLTYATTITGASGSPQYALTIRVRAISN